MKYFIVLFLVLQVLPLTITARPVGLPRDQQKALALSPPSSINSFSSSSDLESNTNRPPKRFSFSNPFKKINSASVFRCHSYPRSDILSDLSAHITDLLRSYRESIFGSSGDQERMLFETCYAGYEAADVSPAIYFRGMKAKQMNAVEKLLRNQVLTKFPNIRVVTTSNVLAVVRENGPKVQRRNTI